MNFNNLQESNPRERFSTEAPEEKPTSPRSNHINSIRTILDRSRIGSILLSLLQDFNAAMANVLVSIPVTLALVVTLNYNSTSKDNV